MKTVLTMLALIVVGAVLIPASLMARPEPTPAGGADSEPKAYARMTTSMGELVLELDRQKAPVTVANFLSYADKGFYEGTIFHRVIEGFMVQGGGFTPDLAQKPVGPPIVNEWRNGLLNARGTIAMARLGGQADSATAQFFINAVDNAMLDQPRDGAGYAVFGRVIQGMEVIDKIRTVPTARKNDMMDVPAEPIVIRGVKRASASEVMPAIEAARAAEQGVQKKASEAKDKALNDALAFVKSCGIDTSSGQKTASGLWFVDLKPGDGEQPTPANSVKVHYTGWLTDGKKFDSSVDRGEPASFALTQVIKGWTEGVSMMKVGGKRVLVIPPELAYGPAGRPSIPPSSTLVFEIELLEVLK